jgi:hypothetical protein
MKLSGELLFFRLIFCRFIPSPHPSRFVSTRSHLLAALPSDWAMAAHTLPLPLLLPLLLLS